MIINSYYQTVTMLLIILYSQLVNAEPVSLNFQNIEVRAALQLLSELNKVNIVVSDAVQGNITLRLDNVEYNDALKVILQTKDLAQLCNENVILIGTKDEINNRSQQLESLAPLQTEYLQINYAKASDLLTMLKDKSNTLLSTRGQVSVDVRTNTLLIKDIAENLINIKSLVKRLDVPVRQVMIEAQIVETIDNYNESFGIHMHGVSNAIDSVNNLHFDFSDSESIFGVSLVKLPAGLLIDLELHAAELEEKTKTIARPKIVTQDGQTATIETGQEIPYTTTSQQGSTPITTFKTAALRLEVTPQITPNNKISMDLNVNDDSPSNVAFDGQVGINTTSMSTKILVDDGETIVLGGIFKTNDSSRLHSIPYLGKIPYIGRLFSFSNTVATKNEVLIFVTPRIIDKTTG